MADGKITIDTRVDSAGVINGIKNIESKVKAPLKRIAGLIAVAFSVRALVNFEKESTKLYEVQHTQETKLATIMKQRMGATDKQIQQVKDLASEQQQLGVIGDEVQLAGAQQIATFLNEQKSLESLIPAMNNLIAQQYGYSATAESAKNIGNLFGKVMQGQTTALKRVGITFTEAEEKVLKYGNEQQRAVMLAQVITNNVGNMNSALANTPLGQMTQLSNTVGDIKENFGNAFTNIKVLFLPALNTLAGVADRVSQSFVILSKALANVFGINTDGLENSVANTSSDSSNAAENMDSVADATRDAGKEAKKASRQFDELVNLTTDRGNSLSKSNTSSNIANVSSSSDTESTNKYKKQIDDMSKSLKKLKGYVDEVIKPLKDFALGEEGFPRFYNISKKLANNIKWDKLKKSIKKFGNVLVKIAELTWTNLMNFYDSFLVPMITWGANEAFPKFVEILEGLVDKFEESDAIDNLDNLYKILAKFTKKIGTGLIDFFGGLANVAMDYILDLDWESFNKGLDAFLDVVATVATNVGEGIVTFFSGIQPVASWLTNIFIGLLEDLFSVLNWFVKLPDVKDTIKGMSGAIVGAMTAIAAVKITKNIISGISSFGTSIAAFVTAITANPVMLAATALGALAGAMLATSNSAGEKMDKGLFSDEFMEKLEPLSLSIGDVANSLNNVNNNLSAASKEAEGNALFATTLSDRYFELAGKTNKTAAETKEMKTIATQLADVMGKDGKFGIAIDEATGLITTQKDEVYKNINALKEQAIETAKFEALKQYYADLAKAQADLTSATKLEKDALDKRNAAWESYRTSKTEDSFKEAHRLHQEWVAAHTAAEKAKENYDKASSSVSALEKSLENFNPSSSTEKLKSESKTISDSYGETGKKSAENFTAGMAGVLEKAENQKKIVDAVKAVGKQSSEAFTEEFKSAFNLDIDWRYASPEKLAKVNGETSTNNSGKIKLRASTPKLATGAVLPPNKPFLATVGDQRHGTNVEAPLDTIVQAMNIALAKNGGNGGGDIVINIDGNEIFRVVQNKANEFTKRTGLEAFT